ncbi:unnamed protein product [Effrenium voratum]|nr:unnamed protein product [Effrenium voratum]
MLDAGEEEAQDVVPVGHDEGPAPSEHSAITSKGLPVVFTMSRACTCCLCNAKSTDKSPLAVSLDDLSEASEMEVKRPWAKYRKTSGDMGPCREWIKQHNEDPGKVRLKRKSDLLAAQKELAVERTDGGRFIAPKKKFVLSSHWSTKRWGAWDQSKEVTEVIKGQLLKGVFVSVGPEGEFDFEDYSDVAVKERVVEHDSSKQDIFQEEAFELKKQEMTKAVQAGAKARQASSVQGPDLSASSLLAACKSASNGSASGAVPAGEGEKSGSSDSSSSSSESEEDSSEEAGVPLASGPSKAKPPTHGRESSQSIQSTKQQEASRNMLVIDGRATRARKTLEEKLQKEASAFAEVSLVDPPCGQEAERLKAYKQDCSKRSAALGKVVRGCRDNIRRANQSSNKDNLQDLVEALEGLEASATATQRLLALVCVANPEPDAYITAFDAWNEAMEGFQPCLQSLGLPARILGPGFHLACLLARASQSLLYSDHGAFCQQLQATCPEARALVAALGKQQAEELVTVQVEQRVLGALRNIASEEVVAFEADKGRSAQKPTLEEATALVTAVLEACKEPDFLARELQSALGKAKVLLEQTDLLALKEQLEVLDNVKETGKVQDQPALLRFFCQHEMGVSLTAVAARRISTSGEETAFKEACGRVSELLGKLANALTFSAATRTASLGAEFLDELVLPAGKALAEVKKCPFAADACSKKSKKPEASKAAEELATMERHLKDTASQLARIELQARLYEQLFLGCNVVGSGCGKTTVSLTAVSRNAVAYALEHNCQIESDGEMSIINLDDVENGLRATSCVEHPAWAFVPGDLPWRDEYRALSKILVEVSRFSLHRQPSFQHVPPIAVEAPALHAWSTEMMPKLERWVSASGLLEKTEKLLLQPVRAELASLFSVGLESVAPVVSQCVQSLLGAGLSSNMAAELLSRVPKTHKLRDLVTAFLEVAKHGPHGAGQKTNDELRGFAKKLCCLSEKLCVAVKEAEDSAADPAFKQDLEKTRIASEEAIQHFQQRLTLHRELLTKKAQSAAKTLKIAKCNLDKLLGSLPTPSLTEEAAYRAHGVKHVAELAKQSTAMEAELSQLRVPQDILKVLDPVVFGKQAAQGPVNVLELEGLPVEFSDNCSLTARIAGFHVTLIAGLCLLRNPILGTTSDDGKALLKELRPVAESLEARLLAFEAEKEGFNQHTRDTTAPLLEFAKSAAAEVAAALHTQDQGTKGPAKKKAKTDVAAGFEKEPGSKQKPGGACSGLPETAADKAPVAAATAGPKSKAEAKAKAKAKATAKAGAARKRKAG